MLVRVFLRAESFPQKLLLLVLAAAAVIVALYIHDLAQALAAYLFGDETARIQRRLSFNPFKHIEHTLRKIPQPAFRYGDGLSRGSLFKLCFRKYLRHFLGALRRLGND